MSRRYATRAMVARPDDVAGGRRRHVGRPGSGAVEDSCAVRPHDGEPTRFLWRNRVYRIGRILQRWDCSRPWWQNLERSPAAADYQVWRVEAVSGRHDTPGIYELTLDPETGRWYLVRVFD